MKKGILRLRSLRDLPTYSRSINQKPTIGTPVKVKTKYHNETAYGPEGEKYDSKLERDCAEWLTARWKNNEILWFTRQVNFELEGGVVYRADFLVVLPVGIEVIDSTGALTQVKKNKLKQMKSRYGIDVMLWPERS